jgi:hypothetical protein
MQHHHRLEETVICKSIRSVLILFHLLIHAIVPLLDPEIETDVVEEHASFQGALEKLDEYLKGVLGLKQGPRFGDVIEDPSRSRLRYDAQKLKRMLEELVTPLMAHVRFLLPIQIKHVILIVNSVCF